MSDLLYKLYDQGWVELAQHDGYVTYPTPDGEDHAPCMWFAACDNDAVKTEPHPVLGDVPICQRCLDKIRRG